jgi:transcription elongation factor Elf1
MPFCPHCNRNTFEIMAVDVGGTMYNCVQCYSCKAPVSFVERDRIEESDEAFETRVTEVLRVVVSSLQIRMEQLMQTRQ